MAFATGVRPSAVVTRTAIRPARSSGTVSFTSRCAAGNCQPLVAQSV